MADKFDYEGLSCSWDFNKGKFNKELMLRYQMMYTLNKTQQMFEWKIPDLNIKSRDMELRVQSNGYTIIAKVNGKLYSLWGTLGSIPNFNYLPTKAIVANPYLKPTKQFNIFYDYEGEEITDDTCVIIPNDSLYMGLLPMLNVHCSRTVETDITRRILTINMRAMNVIYGGDENTKNAIDILLKKLWDGDTSAILAENFINDEAIGSLPFAGATNGARALTELIESEQYDKASLWNELGLQANYNMKRESINSNEAQLNQDAIIPLPDNMLRMRKEACERINKVFGTNWSVDFSSSWKYKRQEIEAEIKNLSNQMDKGGNDDVKLENSEGNDGDADSKSSE